MSELVGCLHGLLCHVVLFLSLKTPHDDVGTGEERVASREDRIETGKINYASKRFKVWIS